MPEHAVRSPTQARARRTRDRLIDATERLLQQRRFEDVSVGDIVSEAGASVGSFYHLFESKEAIVPLVYARYGERLDRDSQAFLDPERWNGVSLLERSTRIIRVGVLLYRRNQGLMRTVALHARSRSNAVTEEQHTQRATFYDRLADVFLACRTEITHPDPDAAVRFGLFVVAATCRDKILFADAPQARSLQLDDRALANELARVFVSFLQVPNPKERS
ncbi:MAG: hypothetical protein DHS20C21_14720 [Gemmatimonadota bacterium]|nr:MAG: hypothetical protein DHS20C21_14720 [Gemmatimonadota bacterium]